jgi:hypothetical protein
MIPLVCGDPVEGPASYTRFVLPFAYRLVAYSNRASVCFYKPCKEASIWRRDYLTAETAAVLFQRAKWLELQGMEAVSDFQVSRGGRSITVRIGVPRLVLFEWPKNPGEEVKDKQVEPLCIGFLILDASFPDQDRAPYFDDLLDFNEQFRFWQCPYEKHEDRYRILLANCPVDMHVPNGRTFSDSNTMEIYFERWASLLEVPIQDENGRVWRLFPESWGKQAHDWVSGNRNAWESGWIVYADNRAFVWTCAIAQNGWKELVDDHTDHKG